jgi:cyclopropane fatty-acyl-phospholipid synthase-like methyltransferase
MTGSSEQASAPADAAAASLARTYDAFALTYESSRGLFDMTEVLGDFHARLPAAGDLLDLGCGAGEPFSREFVERGWRVTGVDLSGAMLELAARYVPQMSRIQGDMRAVSLPRHSFDAICAIYSLFHVSAVDHPALFARMRDWLRPGGVLLFTYATRAYTGQDRFDGYKSFMGQELYYSHVTPSELVAQLDAAGLELVEARERSLGGETFLWVTARRH